MRDLRVKGAVDYGQFLLLIAAIVLATPALADELPPGERPALGKRITQDMVQFGLSQKEIRAEGLRIFSTPFNKFDGLGDGPINPEDKVSPGGRPTLQNNGTFLRINGLDSQTCLECHNVLSNAKIPATFAVGGVGGVSASAFPGVISPDISDSLNNGFAAIQGRFINPPFNFGAGGVELLAKEMTLELQTLKAEAKANPGTVINLVTKTVSFGSIVFENGDFDLSNIEGIDSDLVVRPFGRKGGFATIREFDIQAMQFHHGIQPAEVVGEGVDADEDGVANELTVGELSALHIFQASLEPPSNKTKSTSGQGLFEEIGCTNCHIPELRTDTTVLTVSFPEVPTDPSANVFYDIDLTSNPTKFSKAGSGIRVELYADLKRHDMGPGLAESTGDPLDRFFTTARLWGVADTAPYLHDGRAVTLTEGILLHGGEAQTSRDLFNSLTDSQKKDILEFLRTLRTPGNSTKPSISSTTPANNATDVTVNTAISMTCSEAMDPLTITAATFWVDDGSSAIDGAVTCSGKTVKFTPTKALDYDTTYTATITTDAKDLAGNALENDYKWSFTTQSETHGRGGDSSSSGSGDNEAGGSSTNDGGGGGCAMSGLEGTISDEFISIVGVFIAALFLRRRVIP